MKKKRILCGAMAAAMTVSLAACSKGPTDAAPAISNAAAETETTTAANAAANSAYTGTVTAVSAASLTLSTESDGDITVPLTDATTYTRGSMGGGQAPDGNPPELPSGDSGDSRNGANGADCSFTARNQAMEGDVIWDSISQLDFYMLDGSTLTGAVLDDETNAGSGGDGCANLYISADSTWVVTGDSVLTNLYSAGTIVDAQGRAVTIVDTNGTVLVQGTSDCTVTVSGYSATVDASGASVSDSFSHYEVAKL